MKLAGRTAEWDRPRSEPLAILVLAHGAGGDLNDELLRGVGSTLVSDGIATVRFNFPYRDAARRTPGSQKDSETSYRAVADEARVPGVPLFCGGKSYGGRIATHIAADGYEMTGLVLLSYPLHPPGRPERLRDAHLSEVEVPLLFVQGTRDPFATPKLLSRTIASLPTATHVSIDGGDHSLRVKGRRRADVLEDVTTAVRSFVLPN